MYERNPSNLEINPEAGSAVFKALCEEFGSESFRHDRYVQKSGAPDFPVRMRDEEVVSAIALSEALNRVPVLSIDYIYADRSVIPTADGWLNRNLALIIKPKKEEANNGKA